MSELPRWARLDKTFPRIKWSINMVKYWRRFIWLLVFSDLTTLRFCFAIGSLAFAIFVLFSPLYDQGVTQYSILRKILHPWTLGSFLILQSLSTFYGLLTRTYNKHLFMFEAILGFLLWGSVAVSVTAYDKVPSGNTVLGLISLWLLIRYPVTNEEEDKNV